MEHDIWKAFVPVANAANVWQWSEPVYISSETRYANMAFYRRCGRSPRIPAARCQRLAQMALVWVLWEKTVTSALTDEKLSRIDAILEQE